MNSIHKYEGSKARIEEGGQYFNARCECGWKSDPLDSREAAIIEFEKHVESDPKHEILKEEGGKSLGGVFLGLLFLGYAASPGFIPYTLPAIGWLDNILALLFGVLFLKKGWDGKSPTEALTDVFS